MEKTQLIETVKDSVFPNSVVSILREFNAASGHEVRVMVAVKKNGTARAVVRVMKDNALSEQSYDEKCATLKDAKAKLVEAGFSTAAVSDMRTLQVRGYGECDDFVLIADAAVQELKDAIAAAGIEL